MRVDVRSRLADVDGCTKGYYTVSPIMKEAKYLISLCKIIFPLITIIVLCQDFAAGSEQFRPSSGTWTTKSWKMFPSSWKTLD
jgi:hypothetical protein